MRPRFTLVALGLIVGALTWAAAPGCAEAKKEETKKEAGKGNEEAVGEFKKLTGEFQENVKTLEKEFKAATTDAERDGIRDRFFTDLAGYLERLCAFSQKYGDDPTAKQARQELSGNLKVMTNAKAALATKTLRLVLEKSSQKELKGQASFVLGQSLRGQYEKAYQKNDKATAAKLAKEAEGLLNLVAKDYADVALPGARELLGQQAKDALFLLQKLSVGKTAPDIEGEDIGGMKLKLSDFRGKVVVLDFWASWCGPCVAMIPHEKELVKRLKDRPFVFIGINADATKEVAQKFIEKQEISWRNLFDGRVGGQIAGKYRIQYFPTIYVLDSNGVIRYRDVRGQDMDRAVEELLKEAGTEKK
jgi:thiol-disulfide isomerase/thioredoxin